MYQDEFVTIKILSTRSAAELEAMRLEAAGIPTNIEVDDCGGAYPTMMTASGARLQVPSERAAEARELLGLPALPMNVESAPASHPTARSGGTKARPVVAGVIAFLAGIGATLLWQDLSVRGSHTYESDANLDGKPDRWDVWRENVIVETTVDRNFDGRVDDWAHYERGILVRDEWDDNFDGKPDVWLLYENDRVSESSSDSDFNGIPDSITRYDKAGIPVSTDWRPNGVKVTRMRSVFQHGRLLEELKDADGDGQFEVRVRYDPFGEPVETNNVFKLLSAPAANR